MLLPTNLFSNLKIYGTLGVLGILTAVSLSCCIDKELTQHKLIKCQLENSELDSAVEQQNRAIEQWKAASQAQAAKLKQAEATASKIAEKAKQQDETIKKAKVPADCVAAVKWAAKQAIMLKDNK